MRARYLIVAAAAVKRARAQTSGARLQEPLGAQGPGPAGARACAQWGAVRVSWPGTVAASRRLVSPPRRRVCARCARFYCRRRRARCRVEGDERSAASPKGENAAVGFTLRC
eukprot:990088-Pleurochrysis_carterae.AAC.1